MQVAVDSLFTMILSIICIDLDREGFGIQRPITFTPPPSPIKHTPFPPNALSQHPSQSLYDMSH